MNVQSQRADSWTLKKQLRPSTLAFLAPEQPLSAASKWIMSGSNGFGKASYSRDAGLGSSGSISSSFLGLKDELERSKASSSTWSSKRKSYKSSESDLQSRSKKLSSAFLETSSSKKPKHDARCDVNDSKRKKRSTRPSDAEASRSEFDRIRSNLERKARIYDQLQAGKFAGFTSAELKEGSIDWERKRLEPHPPSRSPSPTETADEPVIEYVDEFGRTRKSRLSDVPRELLSSKYGGDRPDELESEPTDNAIYGPASSFPVYTPKLHTAERDAQRDAHSKHFDPHFDRRHRGAAFYKFSENEDERRIQLDQLAELRRETVRLRSELDTTDGEERKASRGDTECS